jgi:hypothetical protein
MTETNNYVLSAIDVGRMFTSNHGYIGIGPHETKVGRPSLNLKGRFRYCQVPRFIFEVSATDAT